MGNTFCTSLSARPRDPYGPPVPPKKGGSPGASVAHQGPPTPPHGPPRYPPVTPSRNETLHMRNGRGAAEIQAADPWGPPRYTPVTPSIPSACVTPARSKRDPPHAKRTRGSRDTGRGPLGTPQVSPVTPSIQCQCLRDPGPVETSRPVCETNHRRPRYGPKWAPCLKHGGPRTVY